MPLLNAAEVHNRRVFKGVAVAALASMALLCSFKFVENSITERLRTEPAATSAPAFPAEVAPSLSAIPEPQDNQPTAWSGGDQMPASAAQDRIRLGLGDAELRPDFPRDRVAVETQADLDELLSYRAQLYADRHGVSREEAQAAAACGTFMYAPFDGIEVPQIEVGTALQALEQGRHLDAAAACGSLAMQIAEQSPHPL